MSQSRSKKALRNTFCQLLLEAVTAICGLILPRLILARFGSSYNGITQSITQFISCVALLKSGIGSVTRAALYKPLAQHDSTAISEVINATEKFMRKIALIFSIAVLIFAAIYPLMVAEDFSWEFAFTLVLILSISTVAQYFFGITYQMLIEADQCNYIISLLQIITTVANTVVSAILIKVGCTIHIVKLGSAFVFVIAPLFYYFYARKKYNIDKRVKANNSLISQRWDAFGHQLANFVNNNTDIIITTAFLGVREVSVYAVYAMIASNIKKIINSFTSGTTAAFGNMIARNEQDTLKKRFEQFEVAIFYICSLMFITTAILFVPFIALYTKGIYDVDYCRPVLGYLFCIAEFFACIKLIYENVVFAAGKFKETRNMAYMEATINIIVSVVLAKIIGLTGIIIGTILAGAFRTIVYNLYASVNIVYRKPRKIVKKIIYVMASSIICFCIVQAIGLPIIENYLQWMFFAVFVLIIAFFITTLLGVVLFRKEFIGLLNIIIRSHKNR